MKNVKLILGILLILFITGCTKEDIDLEKLVLSGDSITYSDSERLFITESDLDLMEKLGKYTITWTSSHPNVISETGTVTRPSKEESDIEVTLKATLNGLEKTFTIKVLKMPSISDLTPLYGTYNMLFLGGSKQNGFVQSRSPLSL
ncbi:hypothetical protein N7603_07585 [Acholeplasma vituli]|uniref:Atrophied bacterial Ig domain-containing protein n=1 Tax=Paracholeplasma vituli TaxID=69473 RepID=A0ABT2Q0T4_9MOLU|nr:immunoglobulin-like domain-containing protein [Paracholeplasma vituli]MCU0105518.1 hypothetical protein [Paracholeplasma vituli]